MENNQKTALFSVFNKDGIVDFAKELTELGWKIIASGGTAKILAENNIPAQDVAELVGGKAILGHRVVTLSREVHAGLMARDIDEDRKELKNLGIPRIDLVCVDLYPLKEETKKVNCTPESVIEQTDVGGPTLLHSAAKGRRIVICDPKDRKKVINWLRTKQPDKENFISKLAAKAEFTVADYCLESARFHSKNGYEGIIGRLAQNCCYGENKYQNPADLFTCQADDPLAIDKFEQLTGTSPSFINYTDYDRLLQTITHIAAGFDKNYGKVPLIATGVKHGNPCGASAGSDPIDVLEKMIIGDTRAIFGGVIATNFGFDDELARVLLSHKMPLVQKRLLDGIIAPDFTKEAVEMFERKAGKCRLLKNLALKDLNQESLDSAFRFRYVRGGFLRQPNYTFVLDFNHPELEKIGQASPDQERDMILAWAIGSTSNSNTITLVKDSYLIGNGVGQQDRVGCSKLALMRIHDAGHDPIGAVAYSDSFFPFIDAPEALIKSGVKFIFSTSGSVHDSEIKEFFKKYNVVSYMIPDLAARGFFGH